MTKQKTDAGIDQRVVLNLSMAQAKQLNDFLCHSGERPECIQKISKRIEKTINKYEVGDPDKRIKQLNEGALGNVIQAAKVINENEKCPGCGSNNTLPEPDGTLLCETCGAIFGGKK